MLITSKEQALHHAVKYLDHLTLVVGEKGDISASCDIDKTCKVHEAKGERFFIVNGERIVKETRKLKVTKETKDDSEIK